MASQDLLEDCTFEQLNEMYREGEKPDREDLDGDFEGGVPAVSSESLLGMLSKPTSLLSSFGVLPWSGKSFSSDEESGRNRILDRLDVAPFEVREGRSNLDGESCLVLDYSIEGNPFVFDFIRDEVRAIDDGVLLGQMYFTPTSELVLYFSLERSTS
jgi:hypothetical protein